MTGFNTLKDLNLSADEREKVTAELTERLIDVAYMESRERIIEGLKELDDIPLTNESKVTITYAIEFYFGDIVQIVGHERRFKFLERHIGHRVIKMLSFFGHKNGFWCVNCQKYI